MIICNYKNEKEGLVVLSNSNNSVDIVTHYKSEEEEFIAHSNDVERKYDISFEHENVTFYKNEDLVPPSNGVGYFCTLHIMTKLLVSIHFIRNIITI